MHVEDGKSLLVRIACVTKCCPRDTGSPPLCFLPVMGALQCFAVPNALGKSVSIVPNGESVPVEKFMLSEYVTQALHYRLNEFNRHVRTLKPLL